MNFLPWIVVPAIALCLCSACSRDPETASTAPPAAEPPASGAASSQEGQVQLDQFKLGSALGSNGAIAPGADQNAFTPDETVFLAMRIRSAPVGAAVRVIWGGPGGITLGEETKTVRPGQRFLHFAADISTIPVGQGYYAEVWAQDRPIARVEFDIIDSVDFAVTA